MADSQLEKKQQEIDDALARYLEQKEKKEAEEFDYSKGFRMFSHTQPKPLLIVSMSI